MSHPSSQDSTVYLDIAHRIGQRIASQGQWQGEACGWQIMAPDPTGQSRDSVPQPATGLLYQGTAGIAWFLAQVAAVTDDDTLRRTAAGGLRHALNTAEQLPEASFGLHSGRLGIAWVAAHLAALLDEPAWREAAWTVLQPCLGKASQDHSLDVIGGAAGAIPALLEMRSLLRRDEPLQLARDLGEHLLTQAHMEPDGWSWATLPRASYRNLAGLAHGAAGIGLALLELALASGDGRYRFAAEMAFLYERNCYDPERENWPDWRNMPLSEMYQFGRIDLLKDLLRQDKAPQYRHHCMTAWCHGSPGVGLSRLRAWELTGQEQYLQEAQQAMRSTAQSLTPQALEHSNFSLCHGALGNCELLLHGASMLQDDQLLARCRQVADHGVATWETTGRPWPSGTLDGQSDASLLLGEAGVGNFYLRLAAPSTPSPLLLRPSHDGQARLPTNGFSSLATASADAFFLRSRQRWQRLSDGAFSWPQTQPSDELPLQEAPSQRAYGAFLSFLEHVEDSRRQLYEDAWIVERRAYEAQDKIEDFTQESLRALIRPSWQDLSLDHCTFRLAADAQLVTTQYAWPKDVSAEDGIVDADFPPGAQETAYLLLRLHQRLQARPLGRFAAAILGELENGAALQDLIRTIAEAVGTDDPATITPTVLQQLGQLYAVGFIDASQPEA